MLLEFIYEMMNDLSPLYIYLSLAVSILYLDSIHMNVQPYENQVYIRRWHEIQIQLLPKQDIIPRITEIRSWITTKTKRIDAPDDDTEAHSFSSLINQNNRGGKQWNQHLYSPLLKNIALF
ncbi:hypothetical protein [Oceanobacillus senegalensis]|uniref:hypothetical protein n=1 Tax=Oceanobacillus senegalensis TaxID=1936063 RepID=UPI000A30F4F9|nr:hypothetical protein [Oceanobacillus senegalensis]